MAGVLLDWIELRRHQKTDGEDLQRLRQQRLREVLAHAYENVPYYNRLFSDHGFDSGNLLTLKNPEHLPVLDRGTLQPVAVTELLSRSVDPRSCVVRHTGGSSARPAAFLSLPAEVRYEALGWLRTWRRLGLRVFDRHATIKHPDDVVLRSDKRWYQRLGMMQVDYLDLRDPIPRLLEQILESKPDVLRAPPSVLLALTREIESREDVEPPRPKLVFCTSERLSAATAQELDRVLGGSIHDLYGATEAGCIGWRCKQCGQFHLNSDFLWIEVLKDGRQARPGELGELVVTNLYRKAMPVIRLGLGDLCEVAESCDCPNAIGDLSIARIAGRTVDSFHLEDGSEISPYSFMPDEIQGVLAYRIQQERWGKIEVLVVPGNDFRPEQLEEAKQDYESHLGGRISIRFRCVDRLPVGSWESTENPETDLSANRD